MKIIKFIVKCSAIVFLFFVYPIINANEVLWGKEYEKAIDDIWKEDCKAKIKKGCVIPSLRKFNKKQFLKDCGIE